MKALMKMTSNSRISPKPKEPRTLFILSRRDNSRKVYGTTEGRRSCKVVLSLWREHDRGVRNGRREDGPVRSGEPSVFRTSTSNLLT